VQPVSPPLKSVNKWNPGDDFESNEADDVESRLIRERVRRSSPEKVSRQFRETHPTARRKEPMSRRYVGHLDVSVSTVQRWWAQYKAIRPEDLVRLKTLDKAQAHRVRSVHGHRHAAASEPKGLLILERRRRAVPATTSYIEPGALWQNGHVGSFNGHLRRSCSSKNPLTPSSRPR